jgi:hypothetical protein
MPAARQKFQRGWAYWFSGEPKGTIFAVSDDGPWWHVADGWGGEELAAVELPAGCAPTVHGFGWAWRTQELFRELLGHALQDEESFDGRFEGAEFGFRLYEGERVVCKLDWLNRCSPEEEPSPGVQVRARVGVHGRNSTAWREADFEAVARANVESVKLMSFTGADVARRLREQGIEVLVRLYDDRFKFQNHPMPAEFADRMGPFVERFRPWCTKFEVHNEPNHLTGIEGWGKEDAQARDFNAWFVEAYLTLKAHHPWAEFGFPGLAIPHRDLEWLERCRGAVEVADWLGAHCYWQNPTEADRNHLADYWGLRFKA